MSQSGYCHWGLDQTMGWPWRQTPFSSQKRTTGSEGGRRQKRCRFGSAQAFHHSSVSAGSSVTLTATASNTTGSLTYSWYYSTDGSSFSYWKDTTDASIPVTMNQSYYFYCKVTDSSGSYTSNTVYVEAKQTEVSAPVIQSATVSKNTIKLTWSSVAGATYTVYMLKGTSGTPTTVLKSGITGTSYTATGLDKKTTYRFAVTATVSGVESPKSAVVSATTENKDGIATGRALLISESTFDWDQDPYGRFDPYNPVYTIFRNRGDVVLIKNMLSTVKTSTGHSWTVKTADNQNNTQIQNLISSTFSGADDDDVSLFLIATHGDSENTGTAAGALSTYQSATNTSSLYLTDLASWLKAVPGSMIVLLESCGSGAGVYQNANGGTTRIGFFDAKAAIDVFAAADTEIVTEETLEYFYDEMGEPLVTEDGTPIVNVGEFRVANKFYVLTASDYLENSYGMAEDFQTTSGSYNVFPYYIKQGVGTSGSMPADNYSSYGNGDGKLTLNELYHYVYDYSLSLQHTLVYPTNSSFVLFKR